MSDAVSPSSTGSARPCPHCDCASVGMEHDASIFAGQTYEGENGNEGWKLRCDNCGAQTCWWHTKEQAIIAWNARVSIGGAAQQPVPRGELSKALLDINAVHWDALRHVVEWWDGLPPGLRQDIEGSGNEPGAIAKVRKAVPYAPQPSGIAYAGPKWRHLKRGSIVTEIARGFAQVAHHPIEEMTCVVIYRHDEDGRYWVRNAVEFDDGRFEAYPVSSTEGK